MLKEFEIIQQRLDSEEFFSYVYGYPSKRTYFPLETNVDIKNLWKESLNDSIDLYIHIPFCRSKCFFL